MAVLFAFPETPKGISYAFHCPGCQCLHSFACRTDGGRPSWTFDGNMESPTFSPSLFYPDRVCHSFVRNGQIQFLADCTHKLAGKTVPMEPLESDDLPGT